MKEIMHLVIIACLVLIAGAVGFGFGALVYALSQPVACTMGAILFFGLLVRFWAGVV